MSRQYSKSSKVAPATANPYCAHCANIGKPESVYRTHFVRETADPNSRIVCPELLSTECPYCFKAGHTKSRCPIFLAKEALKKKEEKRKMFLENVQKKEEAVKRLNNKVNPTSSSKFSVLNESDSDSDSDIDAEQSRPAVITKVNKSKPAVVEQFPALSSKSKVVPTQSASAISYAGIAAKTKSEYEDEQFLKEKMRKQSIPMPKLIRATASGTTSTTQAPTSNFWDGWDSEHEDEMEYAAKRIEAEEYKKKLLSLRATDMDWAQDSDSDEE